MEVVKSKWFKGIMLILSILAILSFFNFVIFDYPFWVKGHLKELNQKRGDVTISSYGDMYGGLNAFVSGLAFLGLLVTIGVQLWLYYRQEKSKKEEKLETASNKLVYLKHLVSQSMAEIDAFKKSISELRTYNSIKGKKALFFIDDETIEHNKINLIVNKIDQEAFFTAYYQQYNKKNDLIDLFVSFGKILKSWQSFIKKLREYEAECNNELFTLTKAFNILQKQQDEESKKFAFKGKIEQIEPNSLGVWILHRIDILADISNDNNQFEIYHIIKGKYESQINEDKCFQAQEYDAYLTSCSETIAKIESIKMSVLELCKKQITDITELECAIEQVKI